MTSLEGLVGGLTCARPECGRGLTTETKTGINGIWVCTDATCIEWAFQAVGNTLRALKALISQLAGGHPEGEPR